MTVDRIGPSGSQDHEDGAEADADLLHEAGASKSAEDLTEAEGDGGGGDGQQRFTGRRLSVPPLQG